MAAKSRVLFRCLASVLFAFAASPLFPEGVERESRDLAIERLRFNLLANSSLVSGAGVEGTAIPQWLTVSGATNAAPIEITTPIPHGLATGESVLVKSLSGNAAANGWWTVTVTGDTTFTLDGSVGSGTYAGSGAVFPSAGQPPLPGACDDSGDVPWTPWFSAPAVALATEFFQPTGEVLTLPQVPPVNSFLAQEIDGSLFHPGENLCLSIEARMPEAALGDQRLKMIVTAAFRRSRVYSATYPASLLTPEYQRIALCFRLDADAVTDGGAVRVEFIDEHLRGIAKAMIWTRPMLNEGVAPDPWTPDVRPMTRRRAFY